MSAQELDRLTVIERVLEKRLSQLVRQRYHDFGPTLITEKLDEQHDIQLACETVRQWLREAGVWKDRRQRRKRVYQPRYRRESLGELIQIDGSHHRWTALSRAAR